MLFVTFVVKQLPFPGSQAHARGGRLEGRLLVRNIPGNCSATPPPATGGSNEQETMRYESGTQELTHRRSVPAFLSSRLLLLRTEVTGENHSAGGRAARWIEVGETFNAQRATFNSQRGIPEDPMLNVERSLESVLRDQVSQARKGHVPRGVFPLAERPPDGSRRKKRSTLNVQRSTLNGGHLRIRC